MEAPEKIYIHVKRNRVLKEWNSQWIGVNDVEYTRTDVFIEKAVMFLKNWDAYRVCLEGHKDWFIEQFENYMKGE